MKAIFIFIFCCLSCFTYSQNKEGLETISELEGKMQEMLENGLNLKEITDKNWEDHSDYFELGSQLSMLYGEYNRHEEQLELGYHLLDLKIMKEFPLFEVIALIMVTKNPIMSFIESEDNLLKAIELAQECVKTDSDKEIREECNDFLQIALNNISVLYSNYEVSDKALEYILMCDTVTRFGSYRMSNIATAYSALGDYHNAHRYFLRAAADPDGLNVDDRIQMYNNLSQSYSLHHDQDSALIYNQKAIKLCKKEYDENHSSYASCLLAKVEIIKISNVGFAMIDSKIADLYVKIKDIFYNVYGVRSSQYLSVLSTDLERKLKWKKWQYQIDALMRRGIEPGPLTIEIGIWLNDKEVELHDNTDTLLQSSLGLIKDCFGASSARYLSLLRNAGAYYEAKEDLVNARICLHKQITGLLVKHQIYESRLNEKLRSGILYDLLDACNNLLYYVRLEAVQFHVNKKKGQLRLKESIFHFNLWSYLKGKELNNKKAISYNAYDSKDKKIISKYEDWCRINKNISVCFEKTVQERKRLGLNIEKLQSEADNIERQLLESLSLNFTRSNTNFFSNITSALENKEIYIDVLRCELRDNHNAYIIRKGDSIPKLIDLGSDSSLNSTYRYYSNYTKKRPSRKEFSYGDEYHGNICYQNFWSKLEPYLEGVSTVYFSPEGVYSKINPNVLYDSIASSFLMDKYDIVYVSNVEDFVHQKENIQLYERPDDLHAVLVGNPTFLLGEDDVVLASNEYRSRAINQDELDSLQRGASLSQLPATQTEIDLISSNLKSKGWDVEVISGIDATEKRVKSIEAPKILHIATHGFFFEDQEMVSRSNMISTDNKKAIANPMTRSGLIFSGAENTMNGEILADDNGWLNSYEASLLNLRGTELVVLSACETGSGDVQNGKGVYGLQRAIRVAGAESLIMSMWEVDDKATQELMTYFYNYWIDKNMTKKDAFNKAQQKIREKYKHPYYWGAFIMLGK